MLFVIDSKVEKKPASVTPCMEIFGIKVGY